MVAGPGAHRGVRMVPFGPRTIRAVTHLDVDDAAIERAGAAVAGLAVDHVRLALWQYLERIGRGRMRLVTPRGVC